MILKAEKQRNMWKPTDSSIHGQCRVKRMGKYLSEVLVRVRTRQEFSRWKPLEEK